LNKLLPLLALLFAALPALGEEPAGPPPQPPAEPDHFQRLEDASSVQSQSFYREQTARARAALDAIPERPRLLERIRALSESSPVVSHVRLAGKRVFYLKLASRQSTPVLCMREGLTGAERVVLDPHAAVEWYAPSPDGRHVAFGIAAGSDVVLRVLAVDASRVLPIGIDRARFNNELAWHPDAKSFFYARVQAGNEGARRYANLRIYRHQLNRDAAKDEIVFAPGVGGARDVPEFGFPFLHIPRESRHAYAIAREGVRREISVHVTDLADLAKGSPRWRKVAGPEDGITAIEGWKDELFLLTHKGAQNLHVMRMKPTAAIGTARQVVPEGDAVIEAMAVAKDAIYLRTTVGGIDRLEKTPTGLFGSRTRQFVKIPFDNAISELVADPRVPGVLLRLEGWIEPPAITQVDTHGELHRTALQPPPAVDLSAMDEVRLNAKSEDGTPIPVTLVYRKSTTLNGRNPTILTAYGSYGVTLAPHFDPALLAWLEAGGVWAVAHVRGGGEFGLAWHMAGMRAQKVNTVRDFIAAAQFVTSYGFTSPSRLAAVGTGAGAIPVAGAMVRRPELFGAVVLRSPMTDMLRLEFTPNGPANVPEFGSGTTPAGREGLLAISPLHQVKDGVAYPAVLITARAEDPLIAPSQAGKMAAQLQWANPAGKPVLLRIDDAGAAGRAQHEQDLADIYAFLFSQLGPAQ
jgi:prolyl oligopeptidase